MAVPKRKLSKSRKRLRRGHDKAASVKTQALPALRRTRSSRTASARAAGTIAGRKWLEVKDD